MGRRIRKVFGSATTIYAYDGDNITEELDGGGNLVAHYTQGAGIDEPLALTGTGGTYFYHADGLGSITSLTDGSGQLAASYVYDSFGKLTASTGTIANPFQYTGREFDSETGLYYYRAGYYDPANGRFLSQDPIGFAAGVNFYVYVGNSPVRLIDPTGTEKPGKAEALHDYLNVGNIFTLIHGHNFADEAYKAEVGFIAAHKNVPGVGLAGDAFRHCFWSCNMAKYLGESVAEAIGDEHEKEGNRHNQPRGDELMDRANNMMGRMVAAQEKCKSCWDACTDLYNQGRLFGLGAKPLR